MRFEPLGDTAVLVRLGEEIDPGVLRLVRAARARIEAAEIPGVLELVPAFNTIAVHYDPARFDSDDPYAALVALLEPRLTNLDIIELPAPQLIEIPVVYGGPAGPDLAVVAAHAGMTPDDVAQVHASGDYLVHMVGFAPGFPYLGGLDPRLVCPRRATPRTVVPAGSVGIGGGQTGIYPLESPGGWQIIGRTPLVLFDPARAPAALLRPGDRVRFRAVAADEAAR